jgi:glycosyltransferase involved in cell wall biosynthesis
VTPTVSVVMPVYNSAAFLAAAIESVLAQTYQDFEYLIVDDGSTDASSQMIADYAAKDARIGLIRHPHNQGIIAARNSGVAVARGEYIAVMDSDDVAMPERLERQLAYLAGHPDVGAVGAAVQMIDRNDALIGVKRYPSTPGLVAWSMLFFNSVAHPTVVIRSSVLRQIGGYPIECLGGTEDYGMLTAVSRLTSIANLPDVLMRYRVWPGSTTSVKSALQQAHSDQIVQRNAAELTGLNVTIEDARSFRGLAIDQYPSSAEQALRIADLIGALLPICVDRFARTEEDRDAIVRDAGVRLWLLAAIAAKTSGHAASHIARAAISSSPRSAVDFVVKVGKRILQSAARSARRSVSSRL